MQMKNILILYKLVYSLSQCGKRLVYDEYWPIVRPVAEPHLDVA